jgi:hypothetical protein
MQISFAALIVTAGFLTGPGCQHPQTSTSFQFVNSSHPAVSGGAQEIRIEATRTVFIDAIPIGPLALPLFPRRAEAAHLGTVTILMRILVGADGRLEGSERNVADFRTPTPFDVDLVEAIKVAVALWRFEPAQIAQIAPQAEGNPIIVSSTTTATSFDVAFTFSPSGRVNSDLRISTGNEAKRSE